jgi:hypothetical protein
MSITLVPKLLGLGSKNWRSRLANDGIWTLASGSHDQLPTQRLLFRKIVKGIDEKDYELGKANMKIRELEERLEQLKPKKRRKVQTSPNSKFVDNTGGSNRS